jgi:hypothetical protein
MYWDNTNNRLGVGTNAPAAKFQVASGLTGIMIDFGGSGNGNNYIDAGSSNTGFTYLRCRTETSGPLAVNFVNGYASAMLAVKGSGSTSATTSLLVQNSGSETSLKVTDNQQITGFSSAQLRFRLGSTTAGQGVSTRDGEFAFGFIDTNQSSGLRLLAVGSGSSYIDGYTEGSAKAQNYPLFIGSRANNTGIAVTGSTTQENGMQTIFGSAVSDASALVQINSTTRGFLPPRMTTAQKNAIGTPAAGLMVYDTNLNKLCVYTTAWETITSI